MWARDLRGSDGTRVEAPRTQGDGRKPRGGRENAARHFPCDTVPSMRHLSLLAAVAFTLVASSASADKGKSKTAAAPPSVAEQVVFSARGDAELVGRANRVKTLPSTLDVRDRAVVGRVAALFRANRPDVARAELATFLRGKGHRLSVDDATATVLWVTREAVASKRADLVGAAEKVQDVDNRVLVLEATLADLRVAATKRRDSYVGMPGAEEGSRHPERVTQGDLASRLAETEALYEKAEAERMSARDAFVAMQGGSRTAITALVACVRIAIERDKTR